MKAFVHRGRAGLENTCYTDLDVPEPGVGEVRVKLKFAGLNHRDIWNLYRRPEDAGPVILGSDGAGVVDTVGAGVGHVRPGDEVVINPGLRWPVKSEAPPAEFDILGVPTNGTFAEWVVVPAENVEPKPKHVSWEEAGVLPLAALTAYRALFTKGGLQPGWTVLIPGIGSGVAVFALLMAKAAGARAIVTSRNEVKRRRALELGADMVLNTGDDWRETLSGEKVDLVIDSVGPATWSKALDVLRAGGTLVSFGATSGEEVRIPLRKLYFGQFRIMGTTMGSREEFREMLQFVEAREIRPVVDAVYSLADAARAFERMMQGVQFGKIALRVEEL